MTKYKPSLRSDVGELIAVCIGLIVLALLFLVAAVILALITFWYITIPAGIIILYYWLKPRPKQTPVPILARTPRHYRTSKIDWIK